MAITGLEYLVFTSLCAHSVFPAHPRVLELGESNWYGDVPVEQFKADLNRLVKDSSSRVELVRSLELAEKMDREKALYAIARVFFQTTLQYVSYDAIDPGTRGSTYQFDLNLPIPITEQFDITLNIGTAEHVFNVYQFFKTMHERTVQGGLMIHTSPFTGWPEHGFYTFQPTLFFDLARTNQYEIVSMVCGQLNPPLAIQISSHDHLGELLRGGKIPKHSHLNVVLRKPAEPREFVVPTQAYYSGALSKNMTEYWKEPK